MATSRSKGVMKRVALTVSAMMAFALNQAVAATAMNGAPIDPQNLVADDLEAEALASYARNAAHAAFRGQEIVIVDYRLPSSAKRLYIVNLMTGAVEPHYVAHGRGSDPQHSKLAVRFGDIESSGMSSLGAYRGGERYQSPAHGPALRLSGLDMSNRSAYRRLIVVHTAPYFDPANGKYGRSLGCFVVTTEDRARVYNVIADNGFLYAGPSCLGGGPGACRKPDTTLMAAAEPAPAAPLAVVAKPEPVAPAPVIVAAAAPAAAPPVVLAAATPATLPIARPAVAARVAPPVVFADNVPAPRRKPRLEAPVVVAAVFDAPVPLAKPFIDSPDQIAAAEEILSRRRAVPAPELVAFDAPVPLAKPALDGMAVASAEPTDDVPVPLLKPALDTGAGDAIIAADHTVTGQADLVAGAEDVPMPQAKPVLSEVALADQAIVVPDTVPGEIPVPAAKPGGLRRVADAGTGR
ncbi:hypothetical protein sos41_02980 [Alphaproteobacteria bacterium SO-S41]|nr:hypothetical protein sos41_02980 [Alphaproteobacteria bacterium SO-S41]